VVDGTNTSWASYVHSGYVIKPDADSTMEYLIREVYSDTKIFLDSPAHRAAGYENYTIEAKDQPSFSNANIIDILPTLSSANDSSGDNSAMIIRSTATNSYPVLENKIVIREQDISNLPVNSALMGQNTADRGRSTIHIPEEYAPLGLGNMGIQFYRVTGYTYKKTYQSYILNHENTGRLYLMVAGTETDNGSSYNFMNKASNSDVVDIFELPGRPILAKRVL
jgi:hypothetical protein